MTEAGWKEQMKKLFFVILLLTTTQAHSSDCSGTPYGVAFFSELAVGVIGFKGAIGMDDVGSKILEYIEKGEASMIGDRRFRLISIASKTGIATIEFRNGRRAYTFENMIRCH